MKDVEGKTAFITGGASGMGLGMAKVFSENGMKVVIADIRQDALDEAMAFFRTTNRPVHPIKLDVTDRKNWASAADEAEAEFGNVHVLVNNAGVGVVGPMPQATYDDWDFVMNVCLWGVVNGVQTFVPRMLKHKEPSHIVNNASMSGVFASGQAGLYITAKYGVLGLTETIATDLQNDNIGCSVYCPGPVHTNLRVSTEATRPASLSHTGYTGPRPRLKDGRERPTIQPGQVMDPIEVGRRVLRGIRRNDLFILSHPEFRDGIKSRGDAIIRAVPDEPPNVPRAEMLKVFGTLTYNPIYDKQTNPGGAPNEKGE